MTRGAILLTVSLAFACSAEQTGVPGASAGGGAAGGGGFDGAAGGASAGFPRPDTALLAFDLLASRCPDDMVLAGEACVDRFEAPNQAGVEPLAMQTAYDGEDWCGQRGKRLCTDVEWMRACQGQAGTIYPYGDQHVPQRCNDDKIWIAPDWDLLGSWPSQAAQDEAALLYQGDPSGSREDCASAEDAFDLTGNVAEWVVRTLPNANDYDHVMKGCYWSGCYGGTLPNCTFVNPAHPGGFRSYEAGFRCCREPD